ncbi:hypothetical protein [Rhodovulum imhoffii]|nr:hypothetical protein [Rhodovulum imhoffii]MBK5933295.1 hypothetical protein [Rhodovulum imhoffii]
MKRPIIAVAVALGAAMGAALAAGAQETKSYDLLFRNGTLDTVGRDAALVYRREVTSPLVPGAETRDSGHVMLSFSADDMSMVELTLKQAGGDRVLGRFPASVGNPMIMYFYESVIRDMAEAAGGSPFYIRNRVKEALGSPAETQAGQAVLNGRVIPTTTISLRPFESDPNRDRMKGFDDLVLRVAMSDEVPGWYVSLIAEAGDARTHAQVYRSVLILEGVGDTQ